MTEHRAKIMEELEYIRRQHGDVLRPEDVVSFAQDETTALHREFEWDDTKAAAEHRLWQARQVIRVTVTTLPSPYSDDTPIRAYVSMPSDRVQPGGGYRSFEDVMSSDELRAELLRDALSEVKRWKRKHDRLKELSPIFRAIDRVDAKHEPQVVGS
jgi:hypothetical protein